MDTPLPFLLIEVNVQFPLELDIIQSSSDADELPQHKQSHWFKCFWKHL